MKKTLDTVPLPVFGKFDDFIPDKSRAIIEAHFGTITSGKMRESDLQVCVHEYYPSISSSSADFSRFKLTIETLYYMDQCAVGDENCKILGFLERQDDGCSIAFQELGENSLAKIIETGKIEIQLIEAVAYYVGKALAVFADLKLAHQGVNPYNIFLKDNEWILGPPLPVALSEQIQIGKKTVNYKAPEYKSKFKPHVEGDTWSYGVLIGHLLSLNKKENHQKDFELEESDGGCILWKFIKRRGSSFRVPLTNTSIQDIAIHCAQENYKARWSISKVIQTAVVSG